MSFKETAGADSTINDGLIIGLDIGGTKCAVLLGDNRGEIHHRVQFPTNPERGFEATFDELCRNIESTIETAGGRAKTISVSIGGPLDIERGVIHSPPNLPGWDDIPLKDLLANRFGLPVFIEHDGNAGALAEWYFGAASGARNVVFLTMGTGFGGGLILNGKIYRGACDMAGEVGHIRLADSGPEAYCKIGSAEAFCSGTGIVRLAALRYPERWSAEAVSVRELADLARGGDTQALAVFNEAGSRLGQALAILIDILNPDVIVIGALAVRLGDLVLSPARGAIRREALPRSAQACRILPAALGERIGDIASLCAAISAANG